MSCKPNHINNILVNIILKRKRQMMKTIPNSLLHIYSVPGAELPVSHELFHLLFIKVLSCVYSDTPILVIRKLGQKEVKISSLIINSPFSISGI